jgi:hypothetical protein
VRERFFHFEFFRTPAGQYVALEVNMRPPGGFTTDMFNFACDLDIYRIWAELLVHDRRAVDYRRRYHCAYASRKAGRPYRHPHDAVMAHLGSMILMAQSVPGVFSSALGDMGYVLRHSDLQQVLEAVRFIQQEAA